jgi:hypothetical protein
MKITTTLTLLYAGLFLFSLMFKLTSTAVIDLTKSDDLRHGMLQEQWSDPILEAVAKNVDYMNPITLFRKDQWAAETDNSGTEHVLQKRYAHGYRSSRNRHHHHHHHRRQNPNSLPWSNPYPSPWSNPYPNSWLNTNPIGILPFQPRYRRSLSIFDNNRRSENWVDNPKQWRVEQNSADRARGFVKSHQVSYIDIGCSSQICFLTLIIV